MAGKRKKPHYLVFTGGVGGAKLALGLSQIVSAEQLTFVVNTGDDFQHMGLHISPDIDTLIYTLSGRNNQVQGWGLEGETWHCMDALKELKGEAWFQLGDKDLATHLWRTHLLSEGLSLSDVTKEQCKRFQLAGNIVPMTDAPVRTVMETVDRTMFFQQYFVKEQCRPEITGYHFHGVEKARLSKGFEKALNRADLAGVIICPSNPFVSVSPILSLPGVWEKLHQLAVPVLAVSPIIGGQAVKGPAAKMMRELKMPITAAAVAGFYASLLDGFILDEVDRNQSADVTALGIKAYDAQTLMKTQADKVALAEKVLEGMGELSGRRA